MINKREAPGGRVSEKDCHQWDVYGSMDRSPGATAGSGDVEGPLSWTECWLKGAKIQ